jgi:hypothetical protein
MAKQSFVLGASLNFDAQRNRVNLTDNNRALFLRDLESCQKWFLDPLRTVDCLNVVSNYCAVSATNSPRRKKVLPRWRALAVDKIISWLRAESPYDSNDVADNYRWYDLRVDLAKLVIEWAEEKRKLLNARQRGASTFHFAGLLSHQTEQAIDEVIYENYLFAEVFYRDAKPAEFELYDSSQCRLPI